MKSLQLTLLCICFLLKLTAQKTDLTGQVTDTLNEPLEGATVMLLLAKDSVLTKFGITNDQGKFNLEKISPDDYILQISYLGYTNLSQPITLLPQVQKQALGYFRLQPENALLAEVEVKADFVPIRMKKDTIEYNAAAFQTKPNAAVEDLLKKLPGVEVDRNGDIKAQGEQVQKVLVDGKEFFGNDPKIATKNLPADAIDKVQVFDKKSDIAEFSGIDDGREAKTINLSLKEDKKQGYFGRLTGGIGTEDRYEHKFNINRFGSNVQLSSLGMFNNTNQQGFSINDYINMMGGLNNLLAGGSGEFSFNSDELGLPLDTGQKNHGFTKTAAGGINLNWDLSKRTQLHASYFFNGIQKEYDIDENQENLLGDNIFRSKREVRSNSRNKGHRLNLNFTTKIDSFQTIKWRTNIGFTDKQSNSNLLSETYNLTNVLENNSTQSLKTDGKDFRWNSNFTYLRRFSKKGRFFTLNIAIEEQRKNQEGDLEAINGFFGLADQKDSLSQVHLNDNKQINYGVGVTYTEPIGRSKYLEINYSYQNFHNDLKREVYDLTKDLQLYNPNLSNHFKRDYLYHRTGLNYKWTAKKLNLNTGVAIQNATLKGTLPLNDFRLDRAFFNVLPKLSLTYDFKATRSLRFNYRTITREPSLEQLSPIIDNSDPLNVFIGNPDLRPEYSHDIRLQFNSFDQFSSVSIFASLESRLTQHKILNTRSLDSQFRQTIIPVNFGEDRRWSSYVSFGAPIQWMRSRINLTTTLENYRSNYIVNDVINQFNSQLMSFGGDLSNKNTEVIAAIIGYKWRRNQVQYDEAIQQNQTYYRQIFYSDLSINFGENWTISSTVDLDNYSNASFGAATKLVLWEAAIAFHCFKNKRGTFTLSGKDLLNQNIGINRYSQLNFVQEQRITSLGRYFLLSFSYALSGFGGNEGGIEVVKRR